MATLVQQTPPVVLHLHRRISDHDQQRFRLWFKEELVVYRKTVKRGRYRDDVLKFAQKAGVDLTIVHDLEAGRPTDEHVTLQTLYKLVRAHGGDVKLDTRGIPNDSIDELYGATTPLEEFWAAGVRIAFERS